MKRLPKKEMESDMPMNVPENTHYASETAPQKNTTQTILIALLVIAAFFIGTLWTKVQYLEKSGGNLAANPGTGGAAANDGDAGQPVPTEGVGDVKPVGKDDHIRGDANAQLAMIEYSDLECPFCKQFHPTIKKISDDYKGKVMWVWRHYPLSFHQNAQKEAEGAECIAQLGGNDAFWKYIDTVFERSQTGGTGFDLAKLPALAGELGVDQNSFKTCLDEGKQTKNVQDQLAGGTTAGVNGTPGTILLNIKTGDKKMVSGAVDYNTLKTEIDSMLK